MDKYTDIKVEHNEDGTQKHIVCDGARYHVVFWGTDGIRCSEPNCEINDKENKQ